MTTFLRYASLLLLGFATLAIIMTMIIVEAEAKENKSNTDTPTGVKQFQFVAPRSDRSDDIAQTSGDSNKGGGDSIGRPRQISVEPAPKKLPSPKIEVAKGEEITYDYGYSFRDEPTACRCGAPSCAGRIVAAHHRGK